MVGSIIFSIIIATACLNYIIGVKAYRNMFDFSIPFYDRSYSWICIGICILMVVLPVMTKIAEITDKDNNGKLSTYDDELSTRDALFLVFVLFPVTGIVGVTLLSVGVLLLKLV